MRFSQQQLDELVNTPKRVSKAPPRELRQDSQYLRGELELTTRDDDLMFPVFIRQSAVFDENFSVGMNYTDRESGLTFGLIRCNGKHGGQKEHPHHAGFHVHYMQADDINDGIPDPRLVVQTTDYASLKSAIRYFLRRVGVPEDEIQKYCPFEQPTLFEM